MKRNNIIKSAALIGFVSFANSASADSGNQDLVVWFSLGVLIFVLLVVIFLLNALNLLMKEVEKSRPKPAVVPAAEIYDEEALLSVHEYDGIRELDNNLPPWWVNMFYITIIFAVIYLVHYHVLETGELQIAEYNKEMELGEQQKAKFAESGGGVNENTAALLTDQTRIKKGADLFGTNCAACHGKLGEGGVGPNLTDKYWLHGGGVKNIFKSIKYGIPEKGMISWQTQLKPSEIEEITSYIMTLKDTNPPNAKEPQGEISE